MMWIQMMITIPLEVQILELCCMWGWRASNDYDSNVAPSHRVLTATQAGEKIVEWAWETSTLMNVLGSVDPQYWVLATSDDTFTQHMMVLDDTITQHIAWRMWLCWLLKSMRVCFQKTLGRRPFVWFWRCTHRVTMQEKYLSIYGYFMIEVHCMSHKSNLFCKYLADFHELLRLRICCIHFTNALAILTRDANIVETRVKSFGKWKLAGTTKGPTKFRLHLNSVTWQIAIKAKQPCTRK